MSMFALASLLCRAKVSYNSRNYTTVEFVIAFCRGCLKLDPTVLVIALIELSLGWFIAAASMFVSIISGIDNSTHSRVVNTFIFAFLPGGLLIHFSFLVILLFLFCVSFLLM